MEIGLWFVNRMSHLATPDTFESRNRSHSTGDSKCQGSKTSGTWNSTLIKAVRAPFDDQVTMATMYLSGDTKQWWRTRYEDVLEGHCEINAWEELNRKLKERLKARTCALPHHLLLCFFRPTKPNDSSYEELANDLTLISTLAREQMLQGCTSLVPIGRYQ